MNELLSALIGVGILVLFCGFVVYVVAKMAEFLRSRKLPPEDDKDILRRKGIIR